MPLAANANATYSVTTIREDLQEAYTKISPTDTPLQAMASRRTATAKYFEWPVITLAATNASNRELEGENAPANDAPTNAVRLGNYCQLSDKIAEVTSSAQAAVAASNTQRMELQVKFKMEELKRDMEVMLCNNVAAVAGAAATATVSAGLPTFLRTNVRRGVGGANGTLSGTTAGFPNAIATDGTLRALTETLFNDVISLCWDAGADPKVVLCGSGNKRKISAAFTGFATRQKTMDDKTLQAAVDVYESDFGTLKIMPSRFVRSRDLFILDPSKVGIAFLQTMKNKPLAETGHSQRRLIWAEYGLQVDTEAAHGIVADIDPAL